MGMVSGVVGGPCWCGVGTVTGVAWGGVGVVRWTVPGVVWGLVPTTDPTGRPVIHQTREPVTPLWIWAHSSSFTTSEVAGPGH